jgi:hypothetical protein
VNGRIPLLHPHVLQRELDGGGGGELYLLLSIVSLNKNKVTIYLTFYEICLTRIMALHKGKCYPRTGHEGPEGGADV